MELEQLFQGMLNERLQSIARKPDAPFAQAGMLSIPLVREVDNFLRFALVKGDEIEPGSETVSRTLARPNPGNVPRLQVSSCPLRTVGTEALWKVTPDWSVSTSETPLTSVRDATDPEPRRGCRLCRRARCSIAAHGVRTARAGRGEPREPSADDDRV